MQNIEKYKSIANHNQEIITEVIDYGCKVLNISKEAFLGKELKQHLRRLLRIIRENNFKVVKLRLERKKIREDLDDLERAYYQSPSYDSIGEGKADTFKVNQIEKRQLKILELKRLLGQLVIETQLTEKRLEGDNELISKLIHLVPNGVYTTILSMTYIDCMSNSDIALAINYSIYFVDKIRIRGLVALEHILKHSALQHYGVCLGS